MPDDVPGSPTSHAPSQPVTEDLVQRVDAALEKTQGHRPHAAVILEMELKRLHNIVQNNPALHAKWGKHAREVPEPGITSEIHREATLPPIAPEDLALADAHQKQQALWDRGMDKLGFTAEKKEFLETIQSTHGQHWKQMASMFQGGVAYTATELLFQFNKINETIADTYENPDRYDRRMENQWGSYVTKTAHEVRMELTDRALSIAEMFRKLNSDSEHAILIAAQVEKLKVEGAQDVKKRKKAKWAATPVTPKPADGA